jgi:hypothetical protein
MNGPSFVTTSSVGILLPRLWRTISFRELEPLMRSASESDAQPVAAIAGEDIAITVRDDAARSATRAAREQLIFTSPS